MGAPDSVRQILQWHIEVPMGSAPGVTSMLTLPQKHVAEGAAAVDILAQPLRESSSAELSADARNMGGECGGSAPRAQAEKQENQEHSIYGQ